LSGGPREQAGSVPVRCALERSCSPFADHVKERNTKGARAARAVNSARRLRRILERPLPNARLADLASAHEALGASVTDTSRKRTPVNTIAASLISSIVSVYTVLILTAVALSWVRPAGLTRVREAVDSMTAPYLRIFRRIVPPFGRLDFSPVVALLTLQLAGGAAAAVVTGL